MSILPRVSDFLDALKASELGAKITADIDAQIVAQRKAIADELEAAHKEIEAVFPILEKDAEAALKAYRVAVEKMEAAGAKLNAANAAKSAASHNYTHTRNRLEQELAETASHLIDEFIAWAREENHNLPRKFLVRHGVEVTVAGPRETVSSNRESIEARRAALFAAIECAHEMKNIPDQAGVPAALDALRAGLPAIKTEI